jgi:hypothetical protein
LLSVLIGCGHVLVANVEASFAGEPKLVEAGEIRIEQYQVAFLFSGNLGGGTLFVGGKSYPFTVGGLGVGGIGVSKIDATGTVYNLKSVKDIEGVYGQARYGFALADKSSGKLWLENPSGVYIELQAKRTGLALALGADGVVIQLD